MPLPILHLCTVLHRTPCRLEASASRRTTLCSFLPPKSCVRGSLHPPAYIYLEVLATAGRARCMYVACQRHQPVGTLHNTLARNSAHNTQTQTSLQLELVLGYYYY